LFEHIVVDQFEFGIAVGEIARGIAVFEKIIVGVAGVFEQVFFEPAALSAQLVTCLQVAVLFEIAAGFIRHAKQLLVEFVEITFKMHRHPFINERLTALK